MNRIRPLGFISLLSLLVACSPTVIVVQEQTIPSQPTFTVIPNVTIPENSLGATHLFDTTGPDVDFSNFVERHLAMMGLHLIERPAFKFQETSTTDTSGQKVSSKIMDVVAMEDDAKSNYIVLTYAKNSDVRIVRRSDRVIVAVFSLASDPSNADKQMHQALVASGLLKDAWKVSQCKVDEP